MFWATPPIALRFCVRCSYSFQMVAKPNFGKFIWHNFFSLPTIMIQASSTQHIESLCASLPIQHIEPQTSLQAHSLARRVYSPLSFKPTPQPVELDHFSLSSRSTPIFSKKRDNKKKKNQSTHKTQEHVLFSRLIQPSLSVFLLSQFSPLSRKLFSKLLRSKTTLWFVELDLSLVGPIFKLLQKTKDENM